ncbi:hypothetical protein JCM8097_001216 [Rhodosporidiobolus ruineniae]
MSTLPPTAVDASTRLLRVLASLAAQLDPVEGIKATTLRGFAEDIEDIRKEHGESLSSEVLALFDQAKSTLSPSGDVPVSYLDAISAHETLSTALRLLASPPPPSTPSPFLRLPTELVARIVSFCQTDDLRLRQNTNLAVSRTCRLFHPHASPILAREMHLFTPGQIERADALTGAMSDGVLDRTIEELTVGVSLAEIKRQPEGCWAGRLLEAVVTFLVDRGDLRKLHLLFHPSPRRENEMHPATSVYKTEVLQALGMREWRWEHFPKVEDLCLPTIWEVQYPLFDPPSSLRRLRLGGTAPPQTADPTSLRRARERSERQHEKRRRTNPKSSRPDYEVLAIPYFAFFPRDLEPLVLPVAGEAPCLTHLEAALELEDLERDCLALARLLTALAPSLRHLALRLRYAYSEQDHNFEQHVLPALQACTLLEHLEVGGLQSDLGDSRCHRMSEFMDAVSSLCLLQTLVLLPFPDGSDCRSLPRYIDSLPLGLHTLVLLTPDLSTAREYDGWNEHFFRQLMEACEDKEIKLELVYDEAEEAWWTR